MPARKRQRTVVRDLFAASAPDRPPAEPFAPGPNAGLAAFIQQHSKPYDPALDAYDVTAFDRDCEIDNAAEPKDLFDLHFYKGKKHWTAIREHIRHYLPPKLYPRGSGVVLDCFSGSGMTGVAAMMEGRPCVLVDASPAASFIAHCYTHPVDSACIEAAYDEMLEAPYDDGLKRKLKKIAGREIENLLEELEWLFETKCDRCGGPATTEYVVYSEQFRCPNCDELVALSDCPMEMVEYPVGSAKKRQIVEKKRSVCPHCMKKAGRGRKEFVISTRSEKHGSVPVAVSYICQGTCKPKRGHRRHSDAGSTRKGRCFKEYDLAKLAVVQEAPIPHWFPARKMMDVQDDSKPWGVKWRAGTSSFRSVDELYTKRNLWALGAIREAIRSVPSQDPMLLGFTASSLILSRMCRSSNTQILNGTYYIPQVSKAIRPDNSIRGKLLTLAGVCDALVSKGDSAFVSNEDSRRVDLPADSVDYIFTDPPYVGKVQYGELNFVWESWLGYDGAWLNNEIVVNPYRKKALSDWDNDLRTVFNRMYSCLKPGRWMSVCFHDTDPETWTILQNACLDAGFEIGAVSVLDPRQKSQNQYTAEKVAKGDLVINCRKPKAGEKQNGTAEVRRIGQRVRAILIETLSVHAGLTRDKLWDIVLKRLLRRGQMAEHRFDDLLAEVATQVDGSRWYLKDEFLELSEDDLRKEESAGDALVRFARLRCAGTPVKHASVIAVDEPELARVNDRARLDEDAIEEWINDQLLPEDKAALAKKKMKRLELGGRLAGIEFYDALFFYLTKYMKNRRADQLPKRNLADFLEEYLVRFADGDRWLYRAPAGSEETEMRKARQSGLGRRIRAFANALRDGDRGYTDEHRPDVKTFVEWVRFCAAYGHYEDGATLYDQGGFTVNELQRVVIDEKEEETAYDAARGFADICKRRLKKTKGDEDEETDAADEEGED